MSKFRQAVLDSPSTHDLTKDILNLAQGKDPVDMYHDVKLALRVLEIEMKKSLGIGNRG